jgi:hypothetical protein
MSKNVGIFAIVGAVVVLAVLVFVLYKVTLAPKGPDPAKAAPEHKDMAEFYRNQGKPGGGQPAAR